MKFAYEAVTEAFCLHLSWDLSIRESNDSMLGVSRITVLRTLLTTVTQMSFRKNAISDACICDRTLLFITKTHDHIGEVGQKSTKTTRTLPLSILRRLNGAKLVLQNLLCLIEHPILCLAFHHSWIQLQDSWTSPVSIVLRQLTKNIGQDFSKNEELKFEKCWFSFQQ